MPKHLQKYVWLDIRGKNNRIKIGSVSFGATKQLHIVINGSDNEVVIDDGVHIRSLAITIGESGASPKAHHTRVHIGEKCPLPKLPFLHLTQTQKLRLVLAVCSLPMFTFGTRILTPFMS